MWRSVGFEECRCSVSSRVQDGIFKRATGSKGKSEHGSETAACSPGGGLPPASLLASLLEDLAAWHKGRKHLAASSRPQGAPSVVSRWFASTIRADGVNPDRPLSSFWSVPGSRETERGHGSQRATRDRYGGNNCDWLRETRLGRIGMVSKWRRNLDVCHLT